MRFNTAIAAMMEFVNGAMKWPEPRPAAALAPFALLLAPYAPHLAEEAWALLGGSGSLAYEPWPVADEALLVEDSITLPVQASGRGRQGRRHEGGWKARAGPCWWRTASRCRCRRVERGRQGGWHEGGWKARAGPCWWRVTAYLSLCGAAPRLPASRHGHRGLQSARL
jgi:hypothetical protein